MAARSTDPGETILVPRSVRFPVELDPPEGFDPAEPRTWPDVAGRLEWVDGRLLYMPPCGDEQQYTTVDVVTLLGEWVRSHPGFVVGGNEAGMRLGTDTRGADAAIWRRSDVGTPTGGFQRVPPVLAVEVAGQNDTEDPLRGKAGWYFSHGVEVVWLVLPEAREVVVLEPNAEHRLGRGDRVPAHPSLPDLEPDVAAFFRQLDASPP